MLVPIEHIRSQCKKLLTLLSHNYYMYMASGHQLGSICTHFHCNDNVHKQITLKTVKMPTILNIMLAI